MMKRFKISGPAFFVTAAFIGPGTVLTASRAGAEYGFSLLWTVFFATFTAIVLQEMAGRLGIASGSGFAQAIGRFLEHPGFRWAITGLILLAILFGNSAYQTGNLLGAISGTEAAFGTFNSHSATILDAADDWNSQNSFPVVMENRESIFNQNWAILTISFVAWGFILVGRFERLQSILTVLVVLMSVTFLISAWFSQPNLMGLLVGLIPRLPPGSGTLAVALIGTTVVPYNLFLHASATANRWPADSLKRTLDREQAVRVSRRNTIFAVSLGGLVTASVLVTAAVAFHPLDSNLENNVTAVTLANVADIATQLKPVLGDWATLFFGVGLFAAGFTSAITAPVAAGLAMAGCFGWANDLADWRVKATASLVLMIGAFFAICFQGSPQQAILLAQFANGLILPLLAIMLLIIMNQPKLVNRFINRRGVNQVSVAVILIVSLIAASQFYQIYERLSF